MLVVNHLRDLLAVAGVLRHTHVSAASGIAIVDGYLYFVADDEHHLASLALNTPPHEPVRLMRIRPGDLPAEARERKRRKPDFEALAALPDGRLLALGSGSKPNREVGVLFDPSTHSAAPVDLAPILAPLRREFADLNIEGAFVSGERLNLLHRANRSHPENACISYALEESVAWLQGHAGAPIPVAIDRFHLPFTGEIPLGFTDGAAWPGHGWLFSAVAEDTQDSYADGASSASAIGCIGTDGELKWMETLEGAPKVEGIALLTPSTLLMVTDADEPVRPSRLLSVELPS